MITTDIIIAWPRNNDYPLWRQYIHDYRAQFNEIIVVFTETHQGEDYRDFLRQAMFPDHVLCIDNPAIPSGEDWRNVAVHQALLHSYNAPWVFFTEQDFFIKDGFWEFCNQHEDSDVLAVYDNDRMHPCGILIKRETLNRTQKLFGIVPDKSDHFSIFQKDLESMEGIKITKIPENLYFHMNGLSHNLTLAYNGQVPNWRKDEFVAYLKKSLAIAVPLDERYKSLIARYFGA